MSKRSLKNKIICPDCTLQGLVSHYFTDHINLTPDSPEYTIYKNKLELSKNITKYDKNMKVIREKLKFPVIEKHQYKCCNNHIFILEKEIKYV